MLILLTLGIFIFILINFPDFYAYLKTPHGYFFSGQASYFDPWDINNYFALIRWGQNHGVLVENFYTTENTKPAFIYFLYTLTGKLFPFVNPIILYYGLRVIASFTLIFVIWRVTLVFLKNKLDGFLAVLAVSLGGGLGWLFGKNFFGADVSIGSFTFYEAFTKPHEAIALALFIASLVLGYLSLIRRSWPLNLVVLLFLTLSILFYPYLFISYLVIFGITILWNFLKKGKGFVLRFYLINCLLIGSFFLLYGLHLAQSGFYNLQQALPAPQFNIVIVGYGLFLFGFLFNLFTLNKDKNERVFLTIWFLFSVILIYLPLPFSRLFVKGLFFPLVILSLMAVREYFNDQRADFLNFLLVFVGMFSSVFITTLRIKEVKTLNPWYYQTTAVKQAFNFIKHQSSDGVLSGYVLGNYLPYYSGKKVYLGHFNQTPDFQGRYLKMANFYQGRFDTKQALDFLKDNRLSLIVYGKEEKRIGKINYPFLKKIFVNQEVTVYQAPPLLK